MNYFRFSQCCRKNYGRCKFCGSVECEENKIHTGQCMNQFNCEICSISFIRLKDNIIDICPGCQIRQMNILINKYEGSIYENNIMEVTYDVNRTLLDGTVLETYLSPEEKYRFKIPKIFGLHKQNSFPGLLKQLARPNKYSKYGILNRNDMITKYIVKEIIIERYGIRHELYEKRDEKIISVVV